MAQILIEYDSKDIVIRKAIEMLLSMKSVKIKENTSPYDPEFVEKIERSRKSEGKKVDIENLWT